MKLAKHFDFTQSNLQDYIDCPYRFYLRYIRRINWPALVVEEAAAFEKHGQAGARFHRLIQQYLSGVDKNLVTESANADPNPKIKLWWSDFLTTVPPVLEGEKWVETIFSLPMVNHRLVAKYDLVLQHISGKIFIFDWKTSRRVPKKKWLLSRVQTKLYRFVLAQSGSTLGLDEIDPGNITMKYWFAVQPETPISLPYDPDALITDQTYLSHLLEEIIDRDESAFYRTEDINKCRYCVYRSHCDRGEGAGDWESFDTFEFEPEETLPDLDFEEIGEIKF